MRELKFRACIEVNGKPLFTYSDDIGLIAFFRKFEHDTNIEQSTGINDKHGKEIYEGDIIRVQNGEHTMLSTEKKADASQVVFEWGAFRYLSDSMIENTMEHLYPYNLEVIGNIHENKELLK